MKNKDVQGETLLSLLMLHDWLLPVSVMGKETEKSIEESQNNIDIDEKTEEKDI